VAVGSNSNVGDRGMRVEEGRAAIWEVDAKTGAHRIYAYGVRNPVGLAWEPATGQLWMAVNERDGLGSDLVPDYLTAVQFGGFYGWPWFYWGGYPDGRPKDPPPDLIQDSAIKPDYALGSHVAALGLLFSDTNALPAHYHGGAFVSEHGSWDRSPLSGYRVTFIAFQQGKPVGLPQPVVTGFHSGDEKQLYGAPVGLAQDREGALLIADDVGNVVWRVTSTRR